MIDDQGLIPRHHAELPSSVLDSVPGQTPHLESIPQILQQKEIPWLDRRRLVKDVMRAVIVANKEETEKSLEVERVRMSASKESRIFTIKGQYSSYRLEMESKFAQLFQELHIRVTQQLTRFMQNYGELTTQFKRELENNQNIEDSFKQKILERVTKLQDRVINQIDHITDDFLDKVENEQKFHER